VAAANAASAGVSATVMASVDFIRFDPVPGGLRPVGRMRVVVVRDGRPALARVLEVATTPLAHADSARAAYELTIQGMTRVLDEVVAAAR
jgi:hypothetical protein